MGCGQVITEAPVMQQPLRCHHTLAPSTLKTSFGRLIEDRNTQSVPPIGCHWQTGSSTGQLLPELTRIEQQLAGRGLLPTAATPVW